MKFLSLILLSGAACSACAQTYNGPQDPAAYRMPNNVLCSGIPDYPTGANINWPKDASVGNLQDGLTMSMPLGMGGSVVFMGMSLAGKDRLEGEFIYFDDLTSLPAVSGKGSKVTVSAYHGKTTCIVKTWYKSQAATVH